MRSIPILRHVLFVLAVLQTGTVDAGLRLGPEGDRVVLLPNRSGQRVLVWLENTGIEPIPVLGGTFHFQLEGGSDPAVAPRITGITLPEVEGSLFRMGNASLFNLVSETRLSTALVITQPESLPTEVWIPALQKLPLVTLVLDTSGIGEIPSTWTFRMVGTRQGDSLFDQIDPTDRFAVASIVPVAPGFSVTVSSLPAGPSAPTVRILAAGQLSLDFPATGTSGVRLERGRSLDAPVWEAVDLLPQRIGSSWHWDLPVTEDTSQSFYRVVLLP